MAGVRLHHPSLSSCTFVVELQQPFEACRPRVCPSCTQDPTKPKYHDRKSIHLRLDVNGDVVVSPQILASLQTVFLAGMEVVNEIAKPPTQVVGAVELPTQRIVEQRLNTDQNASPLYVPGRTKYESRDRLWASIKHAFGIKEE